MSLIAFSITSSLECAIHGIAPVVNRLSAPSHFEFTELVYQKIFFLDPCHFTTHATQPITTYLNHQNGFTPHVESPAIVRRHRQFSADRSYSRPQVERKAERKSHSAQTSWIHRRPKDHRAKWLVLFQRIAFAKKAVLHAFGLTPFSRRLAQPTAYFNPSGMTAVEHNWRRLAHLISSARCGCQPMRNG